MDDVIQLKWYRYHDIDDRDIADDMSYIIGITWYGWCDST